MPEMIIRKTTSDDLPALDELYPAAFADEELRPLVRALLAQPDETLSLTAQDGSALIGHALFSFCGVDEQPRCAALLGPVAITPAHQRRGVGSALIRDGMGQLAAQGVAQICVLGDPAYYQRFGFEPAEALRPPYALPKAWAGAWRALNLKNAPPLAGQLRPPEPWRQPRFWSD